MDFKQAWRAIGNQSPGNTTWSADVEGRPVFTAWLGRDIVFDKTKRRSVYNSPPGNWIDRGEGQSYIRRAREAITNGWVCRLIALEGIAAKEKVKSADFDDRFYAVRFIKAEDDGTLQGDLLTITEFSRHPAK